MTWTLHESGGKVRLTLTQGGFADDYHCEGEQAGWLNFLIFLGSLVEYGADWLPPIKLLSDSDDEWT